MISHSQERSHNRKGKTILNNNNMKKILFAIISAVLVLSCAQEPENAGQPVSL